MKNGFGLLLLALVFVIQTASAQENSSFLLFRDKETPANIDLSFTPRFEVFPAISALSVQPDQKILLAGGGLFFGGQQVAILRLHPNGILDRSFRASLQMKIERIVLANDGAILVFGYTPENLRTCVRLFSNGAVDPDFATSDFVFDEFNSFPEALVQRDDKLVVWSTGLLRRFGNDGSTDKLFDQLSPKYAEVRHVAKQTSGKLLIANAGHIFRLNADGSEDATFSSALGELGRFLVLPNDAIIVRRENEGSTVTFLKLNPDGVLQPSFNSSSFPPTASLLGHATVWTYVRTPDEVFRLGPAGELDPDFFVRFGDPSVDIHGLGFGCVGGDYLSITSTVQEGQLLCFKQSWCSGPINGSNDWLRRILLDGAPETAFVVLNASVGDAVAEFSVNRVGNLSNTVSVHYETVEGSARAGTNFVPTSGILNFIPFEKEKVISVPLINDPKLKGIIDFSVRLSNPSRAAGMSPPAQGSIYDYRFGLIAPAAPLLRWFDGTVYFPHAFGRGTTNFFAIEESNDLKSWRPLREYEFNGSGDAPIRIAPGDTYRFFRMLQK